MQGGAEKGRFGLIQYTYGNFTSPYQKRPHFILFKIEGGGYQPPSYPLILSLVETWLMWPWIFDTKGKSTPNVCRYPDMWRSRNLSLPSFTKSCQTSCRGLVSILKLKFCQDFKIGFWSQFCSRILLMLKKVSDRARVVADYFREKSSLLFAVAMLLLCHWLVQ